ncbi:MAG: permease [Actinomycetota bacterium]|nr:permease [Actinomycetota bacterium]
MATTELPALGRPAAPSAVAVGGSLVAAAIVAVRMAGIGGSPLVQSFVVIFTSIVVEALPFILLGALVAAAIEVFLPQNLFDRAARLPLGLQLPAAAMGGFAFPVCECGSVPVARRLIARGMHPASGLAFMLAAPILNPIVLASTVIAYRGLGLSFQMAAGRVVLGLALAVVAGWALGGESAAELLRERPGEPAPAAPQAPTMTAPARSVTFADHLASDFFFMGSFVVAGAALAAALQTVIPQSLVAGLARTPVVGSLALMGIAFVLSLCSEADAFVAVSLTQFPIGAQLAFLVFGPAVDAKLALLYSASFRRRFVGRLLIVAVPVVLAGSLWFEALVR